MVLCVLSNKLSICHLRKVQKAADDLVLGRQHAIAAGEARQPRSSFGIGLLDVKSTMEAAWLQPLLSTLTCAEQRPYKHYMAQAARLGRACASRRAPEN